MVRIRKIFSENLKRLREREGLTQEQFAEKLKISPRYVQRLEGKSCPSVGIDKIALLAKILKAKPAEFFEE